MPKITLTDMKDAIKLHFGKKGQGLTNLQKLPMKKIEEIIKKYNLNMDELLVDLKKNREEWEILRQESEKERERTVAEYHKQKEEEKNKKIKMWEILSNEDKNKVKQVQYDRYVETTTKQNIEAKLTTDKMEEMYKKQGLSGIYLQRENDNTLIVKGVHIVNGWISTIKSKEEYEKNKDEDDKYYDFDYWTSICRYNEDLITKLYEVEKENLLKQGFRLGDDGDFYTTIKIKKRKM